MTPYELAPASSASDLTFDPRPGDLIQLDPAWNLDAVSNRRQVAVILGWTYTNGIHAILKEGRCCFYNCNRPATRLLSRITDDQVG